MVENNLENNGELGELLTRGREKLALSQKEIASRLNLKKEIIEALDANDFDNLPAATYVRGYIRSYARAIDLNADALINIYEDSAKAPPDILPDVKPPIQASSKDRPVKAVTYLIAFTLVILIITWWQGQHIVPTNIFLFGAKTSEGGKHPGGFTYRYDIVTHPGAFIPGKTYNSDSKSKKITSSSDPVKLSSPEISSSLNAQTNLGILTMELTAESWIAVYDVFGEKLYVNLAKPGEKISLSGAVPLSVKLGNTRAVSVNFNGKSFDPNKYATRDGVSTFLLE